MANVLRVEYADIGMFCYMLQTVNQWRAPEVGESLYLRYYYRSEVPDGEYLGQAHFFHIGGAGSDYLSMWRNEGTVQGGRHALTVNWEPQSAPEYPSGISVETGRTYRIEHRLERRTSTQMHMDVRVYDSAGNLLYTDADFYNDLGSLEASDPTEVLPSAASLRTIELGNNDPGGGQWFGTGGEVYTYFGGVAVSLEGWVGPYTPGEGS